MADLPNSWGEPDAEMRRETDLNSWHAYLPGYAWRAQPRDRRLREAGSYGYLVQVQVPAAALRRAHQAREIVVRLEVDPALPGGLAIYGEHFGRYLADPTLVMSVP